MYQLYIANKNYSSWSLRPWVLMTQLDITFDECLESFETQDNFEKFRGFSPSGTVPCLVDGSTVVWDSMGIVEYLAERHPGIWPERGDARTFARCVAAEMHSSFSTLRSNCPMVCAITVTMHEISDALMRDVRRIDEIWQEGLTRFGGPFLAGDQFSAADAFYCPVAYRVKTYQLPMSQTSQDYCDRLLALPAIRQWDAAAIAETWREQSHEDDVAAVGQIVSDRRSRD
jgi:glutathione S-transferase